MRVSVQGSDLDVTRCLYIEFYDHARANDASLGYLRARSDDETRVHAKKWKKKTLARPKF